MFHKSNKASYSKNPSAQRSRTWRNNRKINILNPVTDAPTDGRTSFSVMRACIQHNNIDRFNKCINKGFNHQAESSNGWTLLHVAAMYGREKLLRLLLKLRVDPKRLTHNGLNFVDIAQIYGKHKLVKKYKKTTPLSPLSLNLNTNQANPDA